MVPKYLYKYRPMNLHTIKIFESHKIWAPCLINLNDPFDGNIVYNKSITGKEFKEFILGYLKKEDSSDEEIQMVIDDFLDGNEDFKPGKIEQLHKGIDSSLRAYERYGVVCLSEHPDNLLMWTHYCSEHKGICIEFEKTPGTPMDQSNVCFKMRYSISYPSVSVLDYYNLKDEEAVKKTLFTKSSEWKYEDEWRYIESEGNKECDLPGRISSIIFGLNANEKDINKIKSITEDQNILYKHTRLSDTEYRVIIDERSA
jgi:hypothetical protein